MDKTCAWCHKPTSLPKIFAADVPILDWMEEKIDVFCNKNGINRNILWSEGSDWGKLDLDEKTEAELLVYDELIETYSKKRDELNDKYSEDQKSGIISDKQSKNFSTTDEIYEMINKMADELKPIKKKENLNSKELALLQVFILYNI